MDGSTIDNRKELKFDKKIFIYTFIVILFFGVGFFIGIGIKSKQVIELEKRITEITDTNNKLKSINSELENTNNRLRVSNTELKDYISEVGEIINSTDTGFTNARNTIEELEKSINESDTIIRRITEGI